MLRSNSPDRPMVVRRRHWLLQETRFLFLTRKGPVEIILKPSLILGAGFVGVVGMTVIGAATLFVGFKSVEVVRNESITAAVASAPPSLDTPPDRVAPPMPVAGEFAYGSTGDLPDLDTASAASSVPRLPELLLAIDSLPAITLPDWSREPSERPLPQIMPDVATLDTNDATPEDAAAISETAGIYVLKLRCRISSTLVNRFRCCQTAAWRPFRSSVRQQNRMRIRLVLSHFTSMRACLW